MYKFLDKKRKRFILKKLDKTKSWTGKSSGAYTTQKMKFSIKDFFSKCHQTRRNLLQHQKGFIYNKKLSTEFKNGIIEEKSEFATQLNSHYISIVKSTTGKHSTKLGILARKINENKIVLTIINTNKVTRALKLSKINFQLLQN